MHPWQPTTRPHKSMPAKEAATSPCTSIKSNIHGERERVFFRFCLVTMDLLFFPQSWFSAKWVPPIGSLPFRYPAIFDYHGRKCSHQQKVIQKGWWIWSVFTSQDGICSTPPIRGRKPRWNTAKMTEKTGAFPPNLSWDVHNNIWVFPKIVVPPNHPFWYGFPL